jgi:arabinofuranan 3-O-arabinosyltransferase
VRLDRTLALAQGATYQPSIWARARLGSALDSVLDRESAGSNPSGTPTVVASSSAVDEPVGRAGAVVDGNPATAWSPSPTDTNPTLRFQWPAPRTISALRFSLQDGTAATYPRTFRIVTDDRTFTALVSYGEIYFDTSVRTQHLTILPLDRYTAQSFDPYTNVWEALPIAIGEVTFLPDAATAAPALDAAVSLSCGSGPTLSIGESEVRTRLRATLRDLIERREVPALPCDDAGDITPSFRLDPGGVTVVANASELASATRVLLNPTPVASTSAMPVALTVASWSTNQRRVSLPAHGQDLILVVRENTNRGWRASVGGQVLVPIVVDGWQQGWVVPAGVAGEVELSFVPDRVYRTGLLVGAGLLLLLVGLAVAPVRRRGLHLAPVKAFRSEGRLATFLIGGAALVVAGGLLGAGAVALALAAVTLRTLGVQLRHTRTTRIIELLLPACFLLVGGWLALTIDHSHRELWPQVFGTLAVASIWLSVSVLVPRRRGGLRMASSPMIQALATTFDEPIAQRGQANPDGHDGGEDEQRLVGAAQSHLDGGNSVNDDGVPREES